MSRVFRAVASAVGRTRVHEVNMMTREKRRLTASFRALIPAGVTITQAKWDMWIPGDVGMTDAQISGADSSVLIEAALDGGGAEMRCQVTLSDGQVLTQYFAVLVGCGPIFNDSGSVSGASQLVVNA